MGPWHGDIEVVGRGWGHGGDTAGGHGEIEGRAWGHGRGGEGMGTQWRDMGMWWEGHGDPELVGTWWGHGRRRMGTHWGGHADTDVVGRAETRWGDMDVVGTWTW